MDQQTVENGLLFIYGALALLCLSNIAKHVHVISVVLRFAQSSTSPASAPSLPVSNKELESIIDPAEGGRYARFHMPDSLRPFKE